ncbi:Ku protein [Sinorhizobium medicae]|uniref:Non-homologous end joining protein Ku n=2 Tax=Sinorhizobium medicae TaxID=110321 RepID=A6U9E2_SINMW|nr:Ku protein [Sinorhizobium medicae]ABR60272.1 Ku family containing protein [Sinorhizobium medicae WSM419]MBO1940285.1 Ku protein [Sinorhizobium medicae]MBO1962438.1 Ku protein [Sinorhizobium medicae]MDX0408526.1 Ku protein [Sinorhizobium medicae]MDX0414160.1 Ku protein [Sinorhizobium medicae]
MAVAARALWKGYVRFGEVTAPVALYTATSTSERISFHTVNKETGNRVRREFVDSATGKPVEKEDQVKGYELDNDRYVVLDPEEVASAVPESDKTLRVQAFITCDDIEKVYFDKPYYLTPDKMGTEAYALLRDGMQKKNVAAIAQTVLFRRMRTVLLRAHDKGLIATTLNFDYEVRSAKEAFKDIPDIKIEGEMLELAKHIIGTKKGTFSADEFDDRYEAALAELIKAKLEGKALPKRAAPKVSKANDLLEALRQSAGMKKPPAASKKRTGKAAAAEGKKKAAEEGAPAQRRRAG